MKRKTQGILCDIHNNLTDALSYMNECHDIRLSDIDKLEMAAGRLRSKLKLENPTDENGEENRYGHQVTFDSLQAYFDNEPSQYNKDITYNKEHWLSVGGPHPDKL